MAKPTQGVLPYIKIGAAVGVVALAFAYTAGWLSPERLSPDQLVDALEQRGGDPVGHRRNHAKGICFTGYFEANGAGTRLSKAAIFATGRYPVIGRFAVATGDPIAADATGRVRSMAIRVVAPNGEEWRSGMNAMPLFPVATVEDFYQLTLAQDIDPKTGKPDPTAIPRFAASHPALGVFAQWAQTAPWTSSYADQSYNGLNAFRFVDGQGASHAVRWSMVSATAAETIAPADLAALGPDFLSTDLKDRLQKGELRWTLVATIGSPTDPTNDASKVWPTDREQVDLGALVIQAAQDEANGPCRDYNYDPLILPAGIEASDDPLLAARSAAYAESFDRRSAEADRYPRTKGAGQ